MPTLVSWNVNGFRSAWGKGLQAFAAGHAPDVLCLQETKVFPEVASALLGPGEFAYAHHSWHPAEKPGYSGTAIFSRVAPRRVVRDFPTGQAKAAHPAEGRILAAEFADFWLVNVYVPNSRRELERLPYRQNEWDPEFRVYLEKLARGKPVVVCGDFNVAHAEIDLANPASNRRNAGFTDEERAGFSALLAAGFVDTFRATPPGEKGHYSWWTYRAGARARNIGWRIDYFLVSTALAGAVRGATIHPEITGSDHCPVGLEIAAKL